MSEVEPLSDCEADDPKRITDAISCLDYLKRREVFLYKMMNDPSHKAMLYFLEVLMNSDTPVTLEQLAARFAHKSFSQDMREACGGGSADGLREFLLRYPSLFNVCANGQVNAVAIDLPSMDWSMGGGQSDMESCAMHTDNGTSVFNGSTYSESEELPSSNHQRQVDKSSAVQRQGRLRTVGKNTDNTDKHKNQNSSSPSLASTPSTTSSAFEGKYPHGKSAANNLSENYDDCGTKPSTAHLVRRRSNPSEFTSSQPGIYQPPHLRAQNRVGCECCAQRTVCCGQAATNSLTAVSNVTCVHCPLLDLSCHHLCSMTHHHQHATTHCFCNSTQVTTNPLFHCCHAGVRHSTSIKQTAARACDICPLPSLDRLMLETEAVRFFQQRLLKRDERWVQIKSLAGNLSQATPEIRAVVGPQLEFRNFLLKHPQVFEVQGELVSVKDPLRNFQPQRKPKDRFVSLHSSLSSTNLSLSAPGTSQPSNGVLRNVAAERAPRPKSLILPGTQPILPSLFTPVGSIQNKGNMEARRSAHFTEGPTSMHFSSFNKVSQPGKNASAPNTPTTFNASGCAHRRSLDKIENTELQTTSNFDDSCSTDPDGASGVNNANSISITMSADEYRATMFIRKVLEKCGGAPSQRGLTLSELMQILSTKAQEPIQSAIGWTILELDQFILKRSIFFEKYSLPANDDVVSTPSQSRMNGTTTERTTVLVRNKRLERMINIVITSSKATDADGRALINKCGRIFHIAKLWGIIDLGKHEHVFFDKSIFKHVDDLQKYFKVNEVLYFNAVLAPKESRAKWRATQVWKECDREAFEKYGVKGQAFSAQPNSHRVEPIAVGSDWSRGSYAKGQEHSSNELRSFSSGNIDVIENDDTEADEEIQDIAVDTTSTPRQQCDSENYDFALNEEEEIVDDDQLVSAIARQEGLVLANDVKFVADDIMPDFNVYKGSQPTSVCPKLTQERQPTNRNVYYRGALFSGCGKISTVNEDCERQNNYVSSSTEQTSLEVTSSRQSKTACAYVGCKDNTVNSLSSNGFGGISIAVQTVSTGDIMATQLYHDVTKEACPSG